MTAEARDALTQSLGARVKNLRLQAGLSQREVAEAAGLNRHTLLRLELGKSDIGASRLPALAKALGVAPAAFFEQERAG